MFFDNFFNDFDPFSNYTYRRARPQTAALFKNDSTSIMIKKIFEDEFNYICFDCHRELSNLDYFDLKNGNFLCGQCAQNHANFENDTVQPMTGNLKTLGEKDLLILYCGGNRNLYDFIKESFPLLENMNIKDMYSTTAMDYYRKLLRSKAYNEPKPRIPGKKRAYTSIFKTKSNTETDNHQKRRTNARRSIEPFNRDDDCDNIFNSTFFGDDLFNRNRQQKKKKNYDDERNQILETEPTFINNRDSHAKTQSRMTNKKNKINEEREDRNKDNESETYNRISREAKCENNENQKPKKEEVRTITINQIGEIDYYPKVMEIEGMDCE